MGNIRNTLLGLLFFCLPLCRLLSLDSNELKQRLDALNQTLELHFVPHSHMETGFLKSFEEYFQGRANNVTQASVHLIYDTVLQSLVADPQKTFVVSEIAYFERWWSEANQTIRAQVSQLVNNGQLDFVGGGWVMNDESAPSYDDLITLYSSGALFLKSTFDFQPSIAWQIGSFGHSSTHAYLLAKMGFKALFIHNIDFKDKAHRIEQQQLQFAWIPYFRYLTTHSSYLFTHLLYQDTLASPPPLDFDPVMGGDSIVNNPALSTHNIESKASQFLNYVLHMQKAFRTNQLFIPVGCSFCFQNAPQTYSSLDKLIHYLNANYNSTLHANYSTPARYYETTSPLFSQIPTNLADFQPYSDTYHSYWTGFYTSRPTFKRALRRFSNLIDYAIKETTFCFLNQTKSQAERQKIVNVVSNASYFLSTLQGHNTITGTSRQRIIDEFFNTTAYSEQQILELLNAKYSEDFNNKYTLCYLPANSTTHTDICSLALYLQSAFGKQKAEIEVVIVNPTQQQKNLIVLGLPSFDVQLDVFDPQAQSNIQADVICLFEDQSLCRLYFKSDLEPFQRKVYRIRQVSSPQYTTYVKGEEYPLMGSIFSQGSHFNQELVHDLFMDKYILKQKDPKTDEVVHQIELNIDYKYYSSYELNEGRSGQREGSYIFRPEVEDERPEIYATIQTAYSYPGSVIQMLCHERDKVRTVIMLRGNVFVQVDSFVKPVTLESGVKGKDIVLQITTPFVNLGNEFWTDSNGMALEQRQKGWRPDFNFQTNETVSSNFFPVSSTLLLKDANLQAQITIYTDRAQAASVIDSGAPQFIIHRRVLTDDGKGIGEGLDERDAAGEAISFWVSHQLQILYLTDEFAQGYRNRRVEKILAQPLRVYVGETSSPPFMHTNIPISYLYNDTLKDIKITMRVSEEGDVIVRLQNIKDWIDQSDLRDPPPDFIQFDLAAFVKQLFDAANAQKGYSAQYDIYFYPLALNGLATQIDPHRVRGSKSRQREEGEEGERSKESPSDSFRVRLTNQDIAQYRVVFKKQ